MMVITTLVTTVIISTTAIGPAAMIISAAAPIIPAPVIRISKSERDYRRLNHHCRRAIFGSGTSKRAHTNRWADKLVAHKRARLPLVQAL